MPNIEICFRPTCADHIRSLQIMIHAIQSSYMMMFVSVLLIFFCFWFYRTVEERIVVVVVVVDVVVCVYDTVFDRDKGHFL